MNERTSLATDGAVAHSNIVNLGIDFEFDLTAMATPAVRFHRAKHRYSCLQKPPAINNLHSLQGEVEARQSSVQAFVPGSNLTGVALR